MLTECNSDQSLRLFRLALRRNVVTIQPIAAPTRPEMKMISHSCIAVLNPRNLTGVLWSVGEDGDDENDCESASDNEADRKLLRLLRFRGPTVCVV